jgi:hypothetical protein
MRVLLLLLLIAVGNAGCFVFDEIDKGQDIMATHSPNGAKSGSSPLAEDPDETKTPQERLAEYYAKQRDKAKARAAKPKEAEPGDAIVGCKLGGNTQFTRRSDCTLRGGRVL